MKNVLKKCPNATHSGDQIPEDFFIKSIGLFKENVLIKTTRSEMMEFEKFSRPELIETFMKVTVSIKDVDVPSLYAIGGKTWSNFMTDLATFYVIRCKLFGIPVPCLEISEASNVDLKDGKYYGYL